MKEINGTKKLMERKRIDRLNERITNVNQRLTKVEEHISKILDRQVIIGDNITKHMHKLFEIEQRIEKLENQ